MPTDLPKNFSGSAPKAPSALKALGHLAWHHVALPLAGEYAIVYALTGVISSTLLHQAFNQPVMALGVMAAGMLVRNFTRSRQPQQQQLPEFAMPVSPALLNSLLAQTGQDESPKVPPSAGPYL